MFFSSKLQLVAVQGRQGAVWVCGGRAANSWRSTDEGEAFADKDLKRQRMEQVEDKCKCDNHAKPLSA